MSPKKHEHTRTFWFAGKAEDQGISRDRAG
jgi:hypothetical protein